MINPMSRIAIDDTRFIFMTNFSGDPSRDRFGDSRRKVNIIIPNEQQAKDLTIAGYKVRSTKPGANADPSTFKPEYYIMAQVKYRKNNNEPVKYPPRVYLVSGNNPPVPLDESNVGCLDQIRVKNVNVVLNPHEYIDARTGNTGVSLYIRTLYVEQDMDDDPYAARYRQQLAQADVMADDEPF